MLLTNGDIKILKYKCPMHNRKMWRMDHLFFFKSLYLLKLNISKWKLKIKTLVQINSSNIRNTIFCQLASLGTGVLRIRQNLGHCPIATKLMSVANLMFTYPLTNLLIRRYEVIIERSLCQISFHNSSLAGCYSQIW